MNFNLNKVAIIGSGNMGAGIASHIVGAGIPVLLLDIVPKELTEEDKKKGLTLDSKAFRNKFAMQGVEFVTNKKTGLIYDKDMAHLIEVGNLEDDLSKLEECDWIVEVIVERLDIKKNLLKTISKHAKKTAIVTSNTSGISINKIVEDMPLDFKQRFLGTHFFNPPRFMRLFEMIACEETSQEVFDFMSYVGSHLLGKGIVIAKDTPNFIGNRIGVYSSNATIKLMEKYGLSIEEVDAITGSLMGRPKTATFKTIDLVGLDILAHTSQTLYDNLENEDKEVFKFSDNIQKMLDNKQLGNKTRGGFYKKVKTAEGRQTLVWNFAKNEYVLAEKVALEEVKNAKKGKDLKEKLEILISGDSKINQFAWDVLKSVLLYSANGVPEIADNYKEVDKAMVWGYNWEVGPFAIWDMLGFEKVANRIKEDGDTLPAWILERLEKGQATFYDAKELQKGLDSKYSVVRNEKDYSVLDMGDGVLCFEFKTKMNAVNSTVLKGIYETIELVEENPSYKGLVIGNNASNFSAGADLLSIYTMAKNNDKAGILGMIDDFHKTSMKIKFAKKPVVSAPRGLTFGGGLELTMHSHVAVAHAETYMGLVEAGVGIIPAGGGLKELLVRSLKSVEGYFMPDKNPIIRKVWENVAMAKVSKNAFDAKKLGYLRETDIIVMNIDEQLDVAKNQVISLHEAGFRQSINKPLKVSGSSGKAFLKYMAYNMKEGNFISEHDYLIAQKIAEVITGGDVTKGHSLREADILRLERDCAVELVFTDKTLARIEHMMKTGKPLRN